MRVTWIVVSLALMGSWAAQAAPNGVPARPLSIGLWRDHDSREADITEEPWTVSDVVGFLELYPNAYIELSYEDGKPPGVRRWVDRASDVAAIRADASQRGVDISNRVCVSDRPDVLTHLATTSAQCNPTTGGGGCDWEGDMDGSLGEAETVVKVASRATSGAPNALLDSTQSWTPDLFVHRLLVLRPGGPGEERRRVTSNDGHALVIGGAWAAPPQSGDRYEVRGSFDEAWVKRVPLATHQASLARFWTGARNVCDSIPCRAPAQPLDPFAPTNHRGFEKWVDRGAIEALRTGSTVPALYGNAFDDGANPRRLEDPYYRANGVVMDVSNAAYRTWRARYLLYKLGDHGFPAGTSPCVTIAYKPGLHTFHDESIYGPGTVECSEPGTNTWVGPAHVCNTGKLWGGPFNPTPFRAGEYEAGVSAYLRELLATLVANGYPGIRVITAEAPPYTTVTWKILQPDVRRLPNLYGEQGGWIDPPLAALQAPAPEPPPVAEDPGASDLGVGTDEPGRIPNDPPPVSGDTGSDSPGPTEHTGGTTSSGTPHASGGSSAAGSSGGQARAAASTPGGGEPPAPRGFVESSSGGGGSGTIEPPTEP